MRQNPHGLAGPVTACPPAVTDCLVQRISPIAISMKSKELLKYSVGGRRAFKEAASQFKFAQFEVEES